MISIPQERALGKNRPYYHLKIETNGAQFKPRVYRRKYAVKPNFLKNSGFCHIFTQETRPGFQLLFESCKICELSDFSSISNTIKKHKISCFHSDMPSNGQQNALIVVVLLMGLMYSTVFVYACVCVCVCALWVCVCVCVYCLCLVCM